MEATTDSNRQIPFLEQENVKKVLQIFPKIAFVLGAISCIVVFAGQISGGFGGKSDPNVKLVLESTRDGYGTITYEKAYDAFFDEPQWRSFTTEEGESIAECAGDMKANSGVSILAQFTLYPDEEYFELSYLEYNGFSQNLSERAAFLDAVFDYYVYNDLEE